MKKFLLTVATLALAANTASAELLNVTRSGDWYNGWDRDENGQLQCYTGSNIESPNGYIALIALPGRVLLVYTSPDWAPVPGSTNRVTVQFSDTIKFYRRAEYISKGAVADTDTDTAVMITGFTLKDTVIISLNGEKPRQISLKGSLRAINTWIECVQEFS